MERICFQDRNDKKKSNLFDTAICSQLLHLIYYNNLTGFAGGSVVKNLPAMQDLQEIQLQSFGLGRSPGGGNGNPLQYLFLPGESQGQRSLAGNSP